MSYTNSKTIEQDVYANPQDTHLLKELAAWDIPQSLQLNGVYDLPFGKGKSLGGNVNPWLSRFISGWTISGIARLQEGMPMRTFRPALHRRESARQFRIVLSPDGSTPVHCFPTAPRAVACKASNPYGRSNSRSLCKHGRCGSEVSVTRPYTTWMPR